MTFVRFEADSAGRIYGHTDDGEVLPMGLKLIQLASRNDITGEELKAAAHIEESYEIKQAAEAPASEAEEGR